MTTTDTGGAPVPDAVDGATVLFAPETFNLAEVTRGIEVARRMPAGVRCVFSGYSARYAEHITRAGFPFYPLRPTIDDRDADALLALDQGRGLRNPFTWKVLAERVASERQLIRQVDARAVVIGTTLSQIISARAEHVPLVYVKPFAYSYPHVTHMVSTGLLDRTSRPARFVDDLAARAVRAVAPLPRVLPPGWRDVGRAHGVDLTGPTLRLLEADLNLVTTPQQFLPPTLEMPPNYLVVGPIFARLPGDIPAIVHELADSAEPVVYVAVGSSGQRDLAVDLITGLSRAPVQILAPVGHLLHPDDLRRLPPNVHITGWLPAHRLGDAVDLAVTHGGEGTIQNSAAQGWPTIGIPLQLEQRFNIMRVVEQGAARLVEPRKVRGTDWPALALDALGDAGLRRRAEALAIALADQDGASAAADAIVRLISPSTGDLR